MTACSPPAHCDNATSTEYGLDTQHLLSPSLTLQSGTLLVCQTTCHRPELPGLTTTVSLQIRRPHQAISLRRQAVRLVDCSETMLQNSASAMGYIDEKCAANAVRQRLLRGQSPEPMSFCCCCCATLQQKTGWPARSPLTQPTPQGLKSRRPCRRYR